MIHGLNDDDEFSLEFPEIGLTFNGNAPLGPGFTVQDHEGLLGGVEYDSEDIQRDIGGGSFETYPRPRARRIRMSGYAYTTDKVEMRGWEQQFSGLLTRGYAWVTVKEFGRHRQLRVKRRGLWKFEVMGRTGMAEWSMELEASDPRYYGLEERRPEGASAAEVSVSHIGNFWARPRLYVQATTAMTDGYRIRLLDSAGVTLGTLDMAPLGTSGGHTIHTDRSYATGPGGVDWGLIRGGRVSSIHIPPNGRHTLRVGAISGVGAGTITAVWRDTWL